MSNLCSFPRTKYRAQQWHRQRLLWPIDKRDRENSGFRSKTRKSSGPSQACNTHKKSKNIEVVVSER